MKSNDAAALIDPGDGMASEVGSGHTPRKPGRKPKKQRAPRVVKKREYQVCRFHGSLPLKELNLDPIGGDGDVKANVLEPIGVCHPTRADAIAYIDGLKTIGQDITYWIMCRIAIVSVEMKATLSVK